VPQTSLNLPWTSITYPLSTGGALLDFPHLHNKLSELQSPIPHTHWQGPQPCTHLLVIQCPGGCVATEYTMSGTSHMYGCILASQGCVLYVLRELLHKLLHPAHLTICYPQPMARLLWWGTCGRHTTSSIHRCHVAHLLSHLFQVELAGLQCFLSCCFDQPLLILAVASKIVTLVGFHYQTLWSLWALGLTLTLTLRSLWALGLALTLRSLWASVYGNSFILAHSSSWRVSIILLVVSLTGSFVVVVKA